MKTLIIVALILFSQNVLANDDIKTVIGSDGRIANIHWSSYESGKALKSVVVSSDDGEKILKVIFFVEKTVCEKRSGVYVLSDGKFTSKEFYTPNSGSVGDEIILELCNHA